MPGYLAVTSTGTRCTQLRQRLQVPHPCHSQHATPSHPICVPALQVQQVLQNIAMQLPSAPPQILARASAGSGDHAMQLVGTPTSTPANPGLASMPSLPPQAASEAHSLAQASSTLKAQAQTLKASMWACPLMPALRHDLA